MNTSTPLINQPVRPNEQLRLALKQARTKLLAAKAALALHEASDDEFSRGNLTLLEQIRGLALELNGSDDLSGYSDLRLLHELTKRQIDFRS